jgi:hypothetical protein
MAFFSQGLTDLPEIVYLAIVNNMDTSILTAHGLLSCCREIDYGKPPVPQPNTVAFIKKKARIIRATVSEASSRPREELS